jgi:2',3'-cyclic-nucleotide 2'-phosphodiesterase (5'-nucleotidase family)
MIRRVPILIVVHILLFSCHPRYLKQSEKSEHYSLKESSVSNVLNDSLSRYKKKVDQETGRVISTLSGEITKEGNESTLGNFVCDALNYNKGFFPGETVDVVIVNRGGLRANLPKGDIRVINIFELMPFENELVLVTIKGKELLKFVPHVIEKKHPFLGMKIKIKNGQSESVLVGDEPVDETKNYNVLTSDYLANGGDSFTFLSNPVSIKPSGLKIRDAIINYCDFEKKLKQTIDPYKDGRLIISK